jgi:glycosyltransferase involved in cell wall biosynthesis
MVLLHLARWLRDNADAQCAFVLGGSGELLGDFDALGPTAVLRNGRVTGRLLGKPVLGRCAVGRYVVPLARRIGGVDVIYSNTLTNGWLLSDLSALLRRPVVSHAHELEFASLLFTRPSYLEKTMVCTDQFIACSQAVAVFLREKHAIDCKRISVVHEFIPARLMSSGSGAARAELRRRLGIPEGALVVGASGTLDLRKGPDIFMDVARRILSGQPDDDVHFVWVGGSGVALEFFRADVCKAGLSDKVSFVGERTDAADCFDAFDLFLLPSREDPYPLVMLEAAALATPTVCFLGNGGAPEFVEEDAGICVPSGNVEAFAAAVEALLRDEVLRRTMGARAREKVVERHDVSVAAPQVVAVIESTARRFPRGVRAGFGGY